MPGVGDTVQFHSRSKTLNSEHGSTCSLQIVRGRTECSAGSDSKLDTQSVWLRWSFLQLVSKNLAEGLSRPVGASRTVKPLWLFFDFSRSLLVIVWLPVLLCTQEEEEGIQEVNNLNVTLMWWKNKGRSGKGGVVIWGVDRFLQENVTLVSAVSLIFGSDHLSL